MSASEEFDGPQPRPRGSSAADAMLRRRFGGKFAGDGEASARAGRGPAPEPPFGPGPGRPRREPQPHPFASQPPPARAEPQPQPQRRPAPQAQAPRAEPPPEPPRERRPEPRAEAAPQTPPPEPAQAAEEPEAYEAEPRRPRAAGAAPSSAPSSARARSLEEEFLAAFSEDPPEAAPGEGEDFLSEFAPEPETRGRPRAAARRDAPQPEAEEDEEDEEEAAAQEPEAPPSLSSLRRSLNEPRPAEPPPEKPRGKSAEKPPSARKDAAMGLPGLALPSVLPSSSSASGADLSDGRKRSREFALNFERLRKFGFITPSARRSRLSEEIRLIKRRLIRRMTLEETGKRPAHVRSRTPRGRQHVILFTSAKPSEGKSFVAVNLALSIILDEGLNVLLVDADAARPSLSRILGLKPNLKGLTDLLEEARHGRSDVSGRMLRTPDYPLTFIPAGEAVASATDLYGGDAMRNLMADLADRYSDRIILIDGPPLLASTEPVELARHAGQVVMVVDAERTTRKAVEAALDLLGPDSNVNLVLNKATASGRLEQFGSYYEAYANDSAPRKS